MALYAAKAQGRSRIALYEPSMSRLALQRMDLEGDLQRALELRQLLLHYQPAYGMRAGDVRGVEALLRWMHPRRGLLPAGDFIGLAEESGMIVPIGDWAVEEACRRARVWRQERDTAGPPPVLSVNLVLAQLQQPGFVGRFADLLHTESVPPSSLEVEIREAALLQDLDGTLASMGALRDLGVRLALDDFGSGASSLSSLRRLPVQRVKLDRSLIAAVEDDADTRTIVRSLIDLVHALQIQVTAQGIETEGQLDFLRDAGCDCGQGFLLAPPLPAQDIDSLLLGVGV
jgi:EAL domain-containing protein (putative c-di-GMP-specific phosphodiesterase class I)